MCVSRGVQVLIDICLHSTAVSRSDCYLPVYRSVVVTFHCKVIIDPSPDVCCHCVEWCELSRGRLVSEIWKQSPSLFSVVLSFLMCCCGLNSVWTECSVD